MEPETRAGLPRASVVVALGRRMMALCDVTATLPADWYVDFGYRGLVTAYHDTTGSYVTILGGGPEGEEHLLDEKGLTCTPKRREVLTRGGGALSALMVREFKKMAHDRAYRAARASAKKEQ